MAVDGVVVGRGSNKTQIPMKIQTWLPNHLDHYKNNVKWNMSPKSKLLGNVYLMHSTVYDYSYLSIQKPQIRREAQGTIASMNIRTSCTIFSIESVPWHLASLVDPNSDPVCHKHLAIMVAFGQYTFVMKYHLWCNNNVTSSIYASYCNKIYVFIFLD